jgi:hypothetical protein
LEYLLNSHFSLGRWYAVQCAITLGIEDFGFMRTHFPNIKELMADELRRYFVENSIDYPLIAGATIRHVSRDPEESERGPEIYLIRMPRPEGDFVEYISHYELTNPDFDIVGWVLTRPIRDDLAVNHLFEGFPSLLETSYLGSLFGDAKIPEDEPQIYCGKAQIPADGYNGLRRTASMPKTPDRVVAKPLVIVALVNGQPVHALVDSGSLGDLISTTVADQLRIKRNELDEPIVLQLAVQGSRSRINHSVSVTLKYQDVCGPRTFYVANLSGYDMILGTAWLYEHKVTIGLNPARVCIGSADALPLEGVATAKIYTNAMRTEGDVLQAAREQLLEYAKPICKVAAETPLPLLREINHEIPLIDENKIIPWQPSRCPEALRAGMTSAKCT